MVTTPYLGSGSIEVICGPMFSGKTEELIRRVRRSQIARQKVQIFKPTIDDRYHATQVVSHSSLAIEGFPIKEAKDIFSNLHDSTRIVAIDEIQFFDQEIVEIVHKLARRGLRVICAGLDCDYRGIPFGPMPTLLAIADDVMKIKAICTVCGSSATKTYRKSKTGEQVQVGEADAYEARCRNHYEFEYDEEEMAPTIEEIRKVRVPPVLDIQAPEVPLQ